MLSQAPPVVCSTNPSKTNPALRVRFWPSWFTPSLSDCFCLAILVWLFLAGASGWKALLMDGDTGWHIRTGEYILDHGAIPTTDLFSFSKPGAPWFAWEWLSDLIFGGLFRWGGLKAVVLFSGVLISVFSTIVLRFAIWRGANIMVALPITLLAVGSSTIHFLARPHLFTLLLLPAAIWMLESDRRKPSRAVWLLVPLTVLWTNLHGGFAVFLVCLALMVAGIALESFLGQPQWSAVKSYGALLGACSLATLINPQGVKLHVHIFEYLRAAWIRNLVQEFQAPTFRSEGQSQFEILLVIGLIMVGSLVAHRQIAAALWILFLAHSSLSSVRHAPLYAAIVSPLIAVEITRLWKAALSEGKRTSVLQILWQIGQDLGPMFRRQSLWVPLAVVSIACVNAPIPWPVDFPKEAFPVPIVHRFAERLNSGRVLTTDQWADYLIYTFYPKQRVFFDGRSDFYGEKLGREYLSLMEGGYGSGEVLTRYRFDLVLIPVEWPLAEMLKKSPDWSILDDDGHAILFAAGRTRGTVVRPLAKGVAGTNEKPQNSRTNAWRTKPA